MALSPPPPSTARKMRVGIVTLGCDKNTVDNEYLAGLLELGGCELVVAGRELERAQLDAAVVTTCGFIESAKAQSIEAIVELAERKRASGSPRRLFVAGRYSDDLMKEIPEIDGMVGVGQYARLAGMILDADAKERALDVAQMPQVDIYKLMRRRRLEATPHAFLKVSDGCNHTCTFCSIPAMKGKLRSVPLEILLDEARGLIDQGVKELNLVAQDLSMYGMDRWPDVRLPQLLRALSALEGDFWIRCLYYYPGLVSDEFLDVLADTPKLVPYLDMPLQHLHPDTLRRMKRPFADVKTFKLIEKMRARVPNLVLRSTMIVGFPGETEEEHQFVLDGLKEIEFDRLGAFKYSIEDGTPAGAREDQIEDEIKEQRWHAVMSTQAPIAYKKNLARVGEVTRVLIESHDPHENYYVGRSAGEAPEIDGKVFVNSNAALDFGNFVDVNIVSAGNYDVKATPLGF